MNFSNTLTEGKLKSFEDYFKTEPPVSAYDELRRKNLLLQQLAEKMQRSENNFRILTDSLPLMMFSVNSRGQITYTNKWFLDYLGAPPKDLTSDAWKEFVHPSDFRLFSKELSHALKIQGPLNGQFRFLDQASRTFLWHIFSLIPLKNENEIVGRWIGYVVDINPQKVIEQTLKDNQELKETQRQLFENHGELQHKIIELNRSNYELEQFAHLASHDLQEPLRKLFYYSDVLKNKYSDHIDDAGKNTLNSMAAAAGRMKVLIADLLTYSQLQQQKLQFESVDLNEVIVDVIKDLDLPIKEKKAVLDVDHLPVISGNKVRLTQLFVNLIGNALKYSRKEVAPHIQILASLQPEVVSIKIRDNGIGFEEKYKEKIFELFERLHSKDEFPGTGIGLSICRKIAELHNGTIAAISKPGEFSEFEVSLPLTNKAKSVFV